MLKYQKLTWLLFFYSIEHCYVSLFITSFFSNLMIRYDAEATFFDESVRSGKRAQLEEKLLQVIILLCFFI